MTRQFFLIALLSVLLPGGVLQSGHAEMVVPRPFVVALRAMPGAGRCMARVERRKVAARPVRGVYLIPAKQPKSLSSSWRNTLVPDRPLWRPSGRRAPPALA